MTVCIVITNYRTGALVVECLRSLRAEVDRVPGTRVIVVDNASPDDSVERIRAAIRAEGWSGWASLMPLDRNGGFAFGNNAAIRAVLGSAEPPAYVFLLNPDTIAHAGAVSALVEFMEAHADVGIAGGRLEDPDGQVQRSAHRIHSPLTELENGARLGILSRLLVNRIVSPPVQDTPHRCDWVSGASMMVRREVIESIGLMDEGYFLYFEEVDFCDRAQHAGWTCWYLPDSRVMHDEGRSTGIRTLGVRRPEYWYDSRRRFFLKTYGVAGLLAADVLWALGRASLLLRRRLGLGGDVTGDPRSFALDLLWGDLKALATGSALRVGRRSPRVPV